MKIPRPESTSPARWLPPEGWPRLLAIVYFAASIAVLAFSLWMYAPGPRSDALVLFAWAMFALSFPSGLVVSLALAAILAIFNGTGALESAAVPVWLGLPIVWLGFCVAGYVQWFVLVPRVWRRVRHSGSNVLSGSARPSTQ